MAKQSSGFLGGFAGKLGPAVGYMWNGKWCLRSLPQSVRNPRTEAQEAHRAAFREQVRLAARFRSALMRTMTEPARELGMTAYNLFVSMNQHAFNTVGGQMAIDYPALVLSEGPVAPVAVINVAVEEGTRLEVVFDRNPEHRACDLHDEVYLCLYSPREGQCFVAAPVYRKEKKIRILLPDSFIGGEVHVYLYAIDRQGRCSTTAYGGNLALAGPYSHDNDPTTGLTDQTGVEGCPESSLQDRYATPEYGDSGPRAMNSDSGCGIPR